MFLSRHSIVGISKSAARNQCGLNNTGHHSNPWRPAHSLCACGRGRGGPTGEEGGWGGSNPRADRWTSSWKVVGNGVQMPGHSCQPHLSNNDNHLYNGKWCLLEFLLFFYLPSACVFGVKKFLHGKIVSDILSTVLAEYLSLFWSLLYWKIVLKVFKVFRKKALKVKNVSGVQNRCNG
jgi:hypothetical protein